MKKAKTLREMARDYSLTMLSQKVADRRGMSYADRIFARCLQEVCYMAGYRAAQRAAKKRGSK